MKLGRLVTFLLVSYLLWCGYLVVKSGALSSLCSRNGRCILLQQTTVTDPQAEIPAEPNTAGPRLAAPNTPAPIPSNLSFEAGSAAAQTLVIGAADPNTEDPSVKTNFKLRVELTNAGAAINKVTFSAGGGHGFRDRQTNEPYVLLRPAESADAREYYSMASGTLMFPDYKIQVRLDKLNWQCAGVETEPDGGEKATFTAEVTDANTAEPVVRLTKVFDILPNSYVMHCHLSLENLSATEQLVSFRLNGPVGISREDTRTDMRKAVAAFENSDGQIVSTLLPLTKARKPKTPEDLQLKSNSNQFLWAAITNKYFAAIAVPAPLQGEKFCRWISDKSVAVYNPDVADTETIGLDLTVAERTLAPAGVDRSKVDYTFELFLGPKDKKLFDSNEQFRRLGFLHTIDFPACCCPGSVITPLAFFIMWLMNTLYTAIPNYGVVIIILVFVVRLVLHPITKAGQVRMSRFTKILSSPEVAEIKKKYAKNTMEMQKRISEFQKSRGVSPADAFLGMIPMFVQMPIWIALWSAVNASIDLRGAPFLPWWITDLSAPDAIIRWSTVTLPLLGWQISSLNLLPILMGIAFYVQQQTMPQQPAATPEQQQQQVIMKWMMLLIFPIMLYNAPSGVNLYIMASTFAGAIEQYVIKKHIREKEEEQARGLIDVTSKTGGKVKKKKPKPFFRY
jgi:YidC/Oxa1 family membrane protein insertase